MTRLGISSRVFGLAAALGLAASIDVVPQVGGSFLLLCAIAALACVPQPTAAAQQAVPIIEGALVGLILSNAGFVSQPLGLYLVVPALMAGLIGGAVTVTATLVAEIATMSAVLTVTHQIGLLPDALRQAFPWVLIGIGMGLLGSWIRRLRATPAAEDQAGYAIAHRLLDELRVVSRRLSSGLDPVVLASAMLDDCLAIVTGAEGAVITRTDSGLFMALAQRLGSEPADVAKDRLISRCWTSSDPAHWSFHGRTRRPSPELAAETNTARAGGRHRSAMPVKIGKRMVAVLLLELRAPLDIDQLAALQAILDERALPLDAALLFEDVRAVATVEERHRLAREIHDGVAQEIASLGYLVDDLSLATEEGREIGFALLRQELTRILDDLRLSIFDLRSQVSRGTGLGAVLGEYLQHVGTRSGTAVHVTLDESPDRLRLEVEEQLLRIVQEAVTNARKHAGAKNLWVSCWVRPPEAIVVVEDDGSGIGGTKTPTGFGLSIMRERAQRIGAQFSVNARPGGGTRVSIAIKSSQPAGDPSRGAAPAIQPKLALARPMTEVIPHG